MAGLTFGQTGAADRQKRDEFWRLLNSDPQIQAILQSPRGNFGDIGRKDRAVRELLAAKGIPFLEGYQITPTGTLEPQEGFWEGFGQYGVPALVGTYAGAQGFAGGGGGASAAGSATPATAAGETAAGTLPSTAITLPVSSDVLPVGGAGTLDVAGAGTAGIVGASKPTYSQIADLLKAGGQGIGGASTAAQQNQQVRGLNQVLAARGIEDAYLSDAELEAKQRAQELRDTYRQGVVSSGAKSPYDPVAPTYGADYLASTGALSKQGAADLAQSPIYGIRNIPKPGQIFPDPATAFQETGMQKAGDWLGPALTIAGNVPPSAYAKLFSML